MQNSKWEFLTSTRFYSLLIGAVAIYLQSKGFIGDPEMLLIATVTAGFIAIKTVDRAGEKIGNTFPPSSD